MFKCRTKFFTIFIFICFVFLFGTGINAYSDNSNAPKIKSQVEFLNYLSGGNKFAFKVDVENDTEGVIKEFFVDCSEKNYSVETYEIAKNKYVIIVTRLDKGFDISDVSLGVKMVINRKEQKVEGIGVLNGKNEEFRSGQVVSDPMLLYHNQNKITIAIQIDDPWDTLKTVQAILAYPEFGKDVDVSYEKKYVVVSGELKQFVYLTMKGFKSQEVLKFNINLLFKQEKDNDALKGISKVFLYNFDPQLIASDFVKNVYESLLNREATETEVNKSSKKIISDQNYSFTLINDIVSSSEFKNVKMSDEEFIKKIYKLVLNREPDKEGKSYWLGEIKKSSRIEVVQRIIKG